MKKLNVSFYVAYPYYFPHFLPISQVFEKNGHNVCYVLSNKQNSQNMEFIATQNNVKFVFGSEALLEEDIDVIFFANPYPKAKELKAFTIFLEHGIGAKSTSFFSSIEYFDMYIAEGKQKYNRLKELYPHYEDKLALVGFSKFDEVVNMTPQKKEALYNKYHLDKTKKTILYAPTFFPSSIEKMKDDFPAQFKECNIVVKAHYLTFERKQYQKQLKKFEKWEEYDNCTILPLSEYNLVPWLAISDVMISDESSAMFEFASLNKPVISNQYFKLRFSYYFMPWKLKKRIDSSKKAYRVVLDEAKNYNETIELTKEALLNPQKREEQRVKLSKDLCGDIDGRVSFRVYDEVLRRVK